jgi:hypothetical protein
MATCRTCKFYSLGNKFPDYLQRGTCERIHATGSPANRPAQIHPVGNAWLTVSADFGCVLHAPTTGEP